MNARTIHRLIVLLAAGLVSDSGSAASAGDDATNVFVLKDRGDRLVIEAVPVEAGRMQVIPIGDDVIDLIFPPSPGQSGSLITPGSGSMFLVRNEAGTVTVELRGADGSSRQLPSRTIADLESCNIRVNVTGYGHRHAFLIEQNTTVGPDVGPVQNMFAGRVPAAALEGAYVIQTDTYRCRAGAPISGMIPLELDRWPFVQVTLPDGTETDFLVDLGAGETVVNRAVLPDDVVIEKTSMVQYSAEGKRLLDYAPGGATGQVTTVAGHTEFESIRLGDGVVVPGVTAAVLDPFPDMFGRPVGGILGLDVLRRCDRLVMTFGGDAASLEMVNGGADSVGASAQGSTVPMALVGSHLMVGARVNETPVHFVIDTGAPSCFLDEATAVAGDVEMRFEEEQEAHGLDRGSVKRVPGTIGALSLGDLVFADVPCEVAALAAFASFRSDDQFAGLLGNDFFARFERVVFDFNGRTVAFVE